jgi:hypothetical protein
MRTDIVSGEDENDIAGKVDQDDKHAVLAEGIVFEIGHHNALN